MENLSDILLSPEVGITLFIDIFLFFLLSIAFYQSVILLKHYDSNAVSEYQYKLEKKSYLLITIISVSIIIKFLLLPFFVHTLDVLSSIVPGAMCGAGVIQANEFGEPSLIVKIIVVMLSLLWITLNTYDEKTLKQPYFQTKLYFFIVIYILIILELFLEINFFTNISTESPVLCCSTIYVDDEDTNPLPFNLSTISLLILFYSLYILILFLAHFKKKYLLAPLSLFYAYISYYAITYFLGTYIYELPTHKCPFCMLQSDYNFIGYAIFTSLFMATFYALSASIFSFTKRDYKISIFAYTLFIILGSYSFVLFLFKNKTLLAPL